MLGPGSLVPVMQSDVMAGTYVFEFDVATYLFYLLTFRLPNLLANTYDPLLRHVLFENRLSCFLLLSPLFFEFSLCLLV
jgi:hypothetical protein